MLQSTVDINFILNFFSAENIKAAFSYSFNEPWFFTEFSFLFVFGFFLIIYSFIIEKNKWKNVYIILFSLFFYYKSSGPFLGLFILMIISDYFFARYIAKQEGLKKKLLLYLSLVYSLSFLLYFKYSDFVVLNLNQFAGTHFALNNLFLPIGISFYTFQSISYLVDVYRNELAPAKRFSDYAFYMTFFPHLVAGPIVRAKDFLPQIASPNIIDSRLYKESILRILMGLMKKLFIADYLGKYVTILHATPNGFSGFEHFMSMYAYSFQIYFDFSGYSDIAIGIALLLGYRLKDNFDGPYLASNITIFWRKWHISLSNWLKDYIYIPLGGSRHGVFKTYLFLLITMLIGGFWHGADWRFMFWGLAHGLALVLHKIWSTYVKINPKNMLFSFLGVVLTFNFVSICWIFFRSSSFEIAFESINSIFTKINFLEAYTFTMARPEITILILLSMLIVFTPFKVKNFLIEKSYKLPAFTYIILITLTLQLIIQFKDDLIQPFIYFQF